MSDHNQSLCHKYFNNSKGKLCILKGENIINGFLSHLMKQLLQENKYIYIIYLSI